MVVDAWAQVPNAQFMAQPWLEPLLRWTGGDRVVVTVDDTLAEMDGAGVSTALPPDDRRYYPVYVACCELGVPFCTQIGHTGPLCPSEPGRLIPYLDHVLLEFPDLVVVGGHVGFPWIDEVISLATKYPNFHVDTSAYASHRLPPDLVEFMRGRGRDRVLFGTNWPMLSPSRCLDGLDRLELDDEVETRYLRGNAERVFALT